MKFEFEGKCVLEMEQINGSKASQHVQTKFNLDVSKNLDRKQYLNDEGLPNAVGSQALTNVFIQGLIGNIHHANEKGYWNDADHIRYIFSELQRGFVEIVETGSSTF